VNIFGKLALILAALDTNGLFHIVRDALAGAVTAVMVLNLAVPGTLDGAKAEGLMAVSTFAFAFVKLLARNLTPWLLSKLAGA
jgi:hypothetical protein